MSIELIILLGMVLLLIFFIIIARKEAKQLGLEGGKK